MVSFHAIEARNKWWSWASTMVKKAFGFFTFFLKPSWKPMFVLLKTQYWESSSSFKFAVSIENLEIVLIGYLTFSCKTSQFEQLVDLIN